MNSTILFEPDQLSKPLNWTDLFGRSGPVEVEVGCGKGRFLLGRAMEHPEVNFVGLEYARAYLRTLAERAERLRLANVRAAREEAARFFQEFVPESSVSAFHLLYPDPWPKKRHHKRRLIRPDFLVDLRRALVPGALLNLATDHRGYFDWMLEQLAGFGESFEIEPRAIEGPEELATLAGRTNYEIKYAAAGRPLYFITGKRKGAA
ncbi:MAG: tRNA (guanine-N(7)-)-methyltransferase [bacterium]|nr:tRNA (guanine-N(7)-)-methyltransferase [bacterium]